MPDTSRKVEMLAAAFYAGSFILWTLAGNYEVPEPEGGLTLLIHANQVRDVTNLEASSLGLLILAAGLTIAAIRLRKISPQDS